MKFYQNLRHISSLITLTGIIALSCFTVNAMAKSSSAAMVKPTTTTTTTEATTESTTEAATETVSETTTEAVTKADGTLMNDEEASKVFLGDSAEILSNSNNWQDVMIK